MLGILYIFASLNFPWKIFLYQKYQERIDDTRLNIQFSITRYDMKSLIKTNKNIYKVLEK